jgi:hypothetical protein
MTARYGTHLSAASRPAPAHVYRYVGLGDRDGFRSKSGRRACYQTAGVGAFSLTAPHEKGEGACEGKGQPPPESRALVDITHQPRHTTMGYINDFRAKLTALIEDGRTEDAVKFAADKVLESYHNGADSVSTADPADVRKTERFARHAKQNVPPARSGKGRHYQLAGCGFCKSG